MGTSATTSTPRVGNWKAGLTLFGILVLILAIIVPLTLYFGGDDRNRPPAQDRRDVAAVFYPKNDADVNQKSDYSFLETCNFKDCQLPVIVMDNTGQMYRYLVNPSFGKSVSVSPNKRFAMFVGHEGFANVFFNGGLTTIQGFPRDIAGAITQIQDDGSAVMLRSAPRHLDITGQHVVVADSEAKTVNADKLNGTVVACDGQVWRFDNQHGDQLNNQPLIDEYAYNFETQAFVPINRERPQTVSIQHTPQCLHDGDGSFAFFQPINTKAANTEPGEMGLWVWTMKNGAVQDPTIYPELADNPGFLAMSMKVEASKLWVIHADGTLRSYSRETGEMKEHWALRDYFDSHGGHINARAVFKDGKIIAIGKYAKDPETWIGAIYTPTNPKPERLVSLPLFTENYLDRYLDIFHVSDAQAVTSWLNNQPEITP